MPIQAFSVDISEIRELGREFAESGNIIRNEVTTAMTASTKHVEKAAFDRVNHKTGNYGRSFRREVTASANTIVGIVRNHAKSAKGFVYAATLEWGRGPVVAINAKALRFVVNGVVLFRKRVGPAKAQHILEFGARDAMPKVDGEFAKARDRIAARLMR